MDSLLSNLADELLLQDITEPSAVLGALSGHDLQDAYDHILDQFALALLIGAHENSEWSNGNLVIAANLGKITLLQTAFSQARSGATGKTPVGMNNHSLLALRGWVVRKPIRGTLRGEPVRASCQEVRPSFANRFNDLPLQGDLVNKASCDSEGHAGKAG